MIELKEYLPNRLIISQNQLSEPRPPEAVFLMSLIVGIVLFTTYQENLRNTIANFVAVLLAGPASIYAMWISSAYIECIFDRDEDTLTRVIGSPILPTIDPKVYFLTDIIAAELVLKGIYSPTYFIQVRTRWKQVIKLNIGGEIKESEMRKIAESVSRFLNFSHYNEVNLNKKVSRRIECP
jgi:hypothetical protein